MKKILCTGVIKGGKVRRLVINVDAIKKPSLVDIMLGKFTKSEGVNPSRKGGDLKA